MFNDNIKNPTQTLNIAHHINKVHQPGIQSLTYYTSLYCIINF